MGQIKIGAVAWGLPGGGAYAAKTAKKAGLDGIQLELGSYEEGYPLSQLEVMDGYMEDREKYGIQYPALVLNDVMVHEFINGRDTEHGRIAYEQMAVAVRVAESMGIDRIMIPNFLENLITSQEHFEHTREALQYACRLAGPAGILILTENALDWSRQEELIREVGEPNLLVHFDTQNFKFNFDMDQCRQLEQLYTMMDKVMHVKDGDDRPGNRLLGKGNTDFFGQMEILREKGYEGWIVTENYYNLLPLRNEAGDGRQMDLLLEDMETIRRCFL